MPASKDGGDGIRGRVAEDQQPVEARRAGRVGDRLEAHVHRLPERAEEPLARRVRGGRKDTYGGQLRGPRLSGRRLA